MALALIAAGGFVARADAAVRALLVDNKLNVQVVHLQGLGERGVAYFGEDRVLKQASYNEVVQLWPYANPNEAESPESNAEGSSASVSKAQLKKQFARLRRMTRATDADKKLGLLVHVNGQKLAGTWQGGSDDGQQVRWKHDSMGEVSVALDDLAGFKRPGAQLPDKTADDQVRLANGDTLTGFVTKFKGKTLTIEPEGADRSIALPMKRVRAVRLGNTQKSWPEGLHTLTLTDGSRLAVKDLAMDSDKLRFTPTWLGERSYARKPFWVHQLRFTGAGWRLINLADRPRTVTGGGEVFGVSLPPRRQGQHLNLHAPVTVRFDLPEEVQRLAGPIELAPDAPSEAVTRWADCTLTLQADGKRVGEWQLNGDQRRRRINIELDKPETLTLTLEPATNGPILDRVRLNIMLLARNRD